MLLEQQRFLLRPLAIAAFSACHVLRLAERADGAAEFPFVT
jgi:hypothetical protein